MPSGKIDSVQTDNGPTESKSDLTQQDFELLKPLIKRCLRLNHDINNPLAGILGYAEFMLSSPESLTESTSKHLKQIMRAAERIKKLMEELGDEKIAISDKCDLQRILEEL